MPAIISRFFHIDAPASGIEIPNVLRRIHGPKINTGYIEQVIIRAASGGGSKIDVFEIRYQSGVSEEENLVYQLINEPYPVVDSRVRGPFSMVPGNERNIDEQDLFLYVEPEADGVLDIRIDFEMLDSK